jgi:hypothetical protein
MKCRQHVDLLKDLARRTEAGIFINKESFQIVQDAKDAWIAVINPSFSLLAIKNHSRIIIRATSKQLLIASIAVFLTSCAIKPQPITVPERYSEVKKNMNDLFSDNRPTITLTYEEALSRGIHSNYDYRIKLVNSALEADQLRVAEMTMFPDIKTSGSLYTRSNNYATSSTTTSGGTSDVVTSTPKTLRSLREAFTWNLLDLGMSYIRAKEKSERVLIAEEEARKQLQILAQEVRAAYWKAYSAQELMVKMAVLKNELDQTEKNIDRAMTDKLIPKEEIL